MDSASLIARLWLPFTEEPLPTKRIGFCEMPVCCKGHSFFTGLRPEGRGSLSRRVPRAKEAEFKFPPEYYDDEWQAKQREKSEELRRRREEEDAEEEKIVAEYREIGSRFRGYPLEEVKNARVLVSSFIRSGEDIEESIVEAANNGELTEIVLMVIWTRLELARRDGKRDEIQALDLLYRRVESEILKRQSSPAMHLLNELLNMHDGFSEQEWLQRCRICMLEIFPREDPFTLLVPSGIDLSTHMGPIDIPLDDKNILFRVDFIRETDALLHELQGQEKSETVKTLDPQSVAINLKLQEKERTLQQVKALRDLAISLKW